MPSEAEIIDATRKPATVGSLRDELVALGLVEGSTVIVHSSMSSLGWVAGGAHAVVVALLEAVGPSGTIVMPTHTGLTDPAQWQHPPVPEEWIETIRAETPLFDPDLTPTRTMGQVVDCFRRHPGALRSPHPWASFAAVGPRAGEIAGRHPLSPSLGDSSPLGALYRSDALIALLGVGHANNTSLHLAEDHASWKGKASIKQGVSVSQGGSRRWIEFDDPDYDTSDFVEIGEDFAATGAQRTGTVGVGSAIVCSQREAVDFAAAWMSERRPGSLDR